MFKFFLGSKLYYMFYVFLGVADDVVMLEFFDLRVGDIVILGWGLGGVGEAVL